MRFGPVRQEWSVQVEAQKRCLSAQDIYTFASIKDEWETLRKRAANKKLLTNEQILRIAIFCNFDKKRSIGVMKRANPRHFRLSAFALKSQLESRTLFPCPGLKTSRGSSVFYMRPSRYFPNETPTAIVIDNLIYVMDKMDQQKPPKGIAFIANMEGWTMSNFTYEYCRKFMTALQGRTFPAKVDLFLILNPPSWFGKVWAIMKPMLSSSFRKKVFMITEDELPFFMSLDYESYLPDDIRGGKINTEELVRDFVLFHQALERATTRPSSSNLISRVMQTGAVLGRDVQPHKARYCKLFSSWRGRGKKNHSAACLEATENSEEADSSSRMTGSRLTPSQ